MKNKFLYLSFLFCLICDLSLFAQELEIKSSKIQYDDINKLTVFEGNVTLNDKIGNLTYYDSSGQNDYGFTKPYSDVTAQIIDKEISNIIETQYKRAIKLIEKHKKKLIELADFLLDKEVIFKEDLVRIYGERPFDLKDLPKK